MTFKKLLLPPAVPLVLQLLFALWVIIPQIIRHPAANSNVLNEAFGFALSGLTSYVTYLLFNLADAWWDRFGARASWLGTTGLALACGILLGLCMNPLLRDHEDAAGKTLAIVIGMGIGYFLVVFMTMAFVRRCLLRR